MAQPLGIQDRLRGRCRQPRFRPIGSCRASTPPARGGRAAPEERRLDDDLARTTTTWTAHWGMTVAVSPGEEPTGINTYGATFALGPVAFRVYATTQEPVDPGYFE